MVDGMLGSLARKLRMYGFDVLYDASFDDKKLIEIGKKEERTILTADRNLVNESLRSHIKVEIVSEDNDLDRLVAIFKKLSLDSSKIDLESTRCPVCNGLLLSVDRDSVREKVPMGVAESYANFYTCSSCNKVYWPGSHWKRITAFAKKVEEKL